ncbi:forkhead box transcription factor, partial [Salmonella enterica subsp. enterica serovar Aberdeen]|nr:forkhead box transcription factor [Salmonella enterica subsp. enterica serovar Aberdeen]
SLKVSNSDFQTIKVQFRALGLIIKSEKSRSVKDKGTYWTLTPYGENLMTTLRAIKKTLV